MTKLLPLLLILVFDFASRACHAQDTIPVFMTPDDPPREDPNRRHRMPPAPIVCIIDLLNGTISSDSPLMSDAETYQLLTEDGEICMIETENPSEAVEYLRANRAVAVRLRIIVADRFYTGLVSH